MINYTEMKNCLACGSSNLETFCSLGNQPLANNHKASKDEPDNLFPLDVNVCRDCFHSQLSIAVDRDVLYKHYLYVSGVSKTLVNEFDDVAALICKENPEAKSVLDVACNDCTLLRSFRKQGMELYGIDPAENIIESITDTDMTLWADYVPTTKESVQLPQVDIITCFNVVAHVPDPLSMLKECKKYLNPNGTLYIQTSQKDMIVNGEFDTIYHEHHSFFTINSMKHLAERAGFKLHDVVTRPVHGNSYLFALKHESDGALIPEKIAAEAALNDITTFREFGAKAIKKKNRLVHVIQHARAKNHKVVGYGAAAKGIVMLNYHKMPHDYVIDDTPLKINKIIGGVNIPILSSDVLAAEPDDLTIIVYAWNFFDEIYNKIRALRPNNNDVIVPSLVKEI